MSFTGFFLIQKCVIFSFNLLSRSRRALCALRDAISRREHVCSALVRGPVTALSFLCLSLFASSTLHSSALAEYAADGREMEWLGRDCRRVGYGLRRPDRLSLRYVWWWAFLSSAFFLPRACSLARPPTSSLLLAPAPCSLPCPHVEVGVASSFFLFPGGFSASLCAISLLLANSSSFFSVPSPTYQ